MSRLSHYFPDADLRAGYDGLEVMANKAGFSLRNLPTGSFCAFVNRKKDKLKLATNADLVAYLRLSNGERIDPRVIQHLPEHFNGSKIEYNRALEKVLRKQFPKWFDQSEGRK